MHIKKLALVMIGFFLFSPQVSAHFVELTADKNFLDPGRDKNVSLKMAFTHPFENGPLMMMKRPKEFGCLHKGVKKDLTNVLESQEGFEDLIWVNSQKLDRIGDYVFYVKPQPYFEPAENKFIVHYTKTVISNGGGDGWDAMVGFPVEIRPLTRPYGVWTHNLFRGVVYKDGKPVPFAEIEVEHKKQSGLKAPNDSYITQVIKADSQGVFAYAIPKAGWWGFAALIEDDETMKGPDNTDYSVEKGALIWIKADDME